MDFPTSVKPLKVFSFGAKHNVLISSSEDGYEQRRYVWPHKMRKFTLNYDVLSMQEMQTLLDFYNNTASGTYNTFNYTFNYGTGGVPETVVCRFVDDELIFDEPRYRKYSCTMNLIEVF